MVKLPCNMSTTASDIVLRPGEPRLTLFKAQYYTCMYIYLYIAAHEKILI